jgi:choline dehydrogenase-like flavoprotein
VITAIVLHGVLTLCSGGTAACVAAGRLARADPSLSILLVEGGKNNYNDPTVTNPALYLTHLVPGSQTALFYEANSEEALNGRKAIVPCGGLLGGGSSINFMMYTRAQGADFDDWETKGWTAEDLLPLMKRVRCTSDTILQVPQLTRTARDLPSHRSRHRSILTRTRRSSPRILRHILPRRGSRRFIQGSHCYRP